MTVTTAPCAIIIGKTFVQRVTQILILVYTNLVYQRFLFVFVKICNDGR